MIVNNTVASNIGGGGSTFTPINVVKNFYWTNSKLASQDGSGREEVPTIILKERKVKTSSFVAQALYSGGSIFDNAKSVLNALKIGNFDNSSASQFGPDAKKYLSELGGSLGIGNNATSPVQSGVQSMASTVFKKLNEAVDAATDDTSFLTDPWLSYYKGLYITQPTGWVYYMPYMANSYQETSNTWGSETGTAGGNGLLGGVSKIVEEASNFVRNLATSLEVGSYQEKSKFYQFQSEGEAISFSFPLINTGNATFDDVIRNWQFIFLLLYQNRAQRVDRSIISPPPIYEVEIPGLKYMPLSYIKGINVEFKGSRRTVTLQIPSSDGSAGFQSLQTIIPEAYNITISLQSMVTESKNFMYSSVSKNNNIVVLTAAERDALITFNQNQNINNESGLTGG
jgi:hypothetical protein